MKRNMIWLYRGMIISLVLFLGFFPAQLILANDMEAFELGNSMLDKQNYPEALRAYETFLKENPGHRLVPAAMWTMGNIYVTIDEDYEKAADLFQKIVNENPNTDWEIFGHGRLGYCLEQQEKWAEAAEAYEPAVRKLSTSSSDVVTLAWVNDLKGRLLSCYRSAQDYESIILTYREILSENPGAPSAPEDQYNLAQTYLDINDSEEAAENFVLVVERYPVSNYAQRVRDEHAELLTSQIDYDWVPFSTFESALRFSQTGQYDEALSQFDVVIEAKRNGGMSYAARFQKELIEYRKNGEAAGLREKMISYRDDFPYGLGGADVVQLDNLLGAIIEAQETLVSNPDDIGAYLQMGQCYYFTQAYYCGIETYEKAIGIAPDNSTLYNMLGYSYIGVQQYDEAISAFEDLIDVASEDPNSYDSMAEGYCLKGDTTVAIQFYERAIATDSSFSNPYYMLGQIYHERGQNEKAVAYLERFLEIEAGGFRAQNAQSLLDQMNPASSSDVEP
ncbi:MAG: tetratricopeptide repeat protein [candidate division WOR-3 bacterium]|nr:MAG: tetratricopeptide repeat protein [candidate division WOR-3 bacterium]